MGYSIYIRITPEQRDFLKKVFDKKFLEGSTLLNSLKPCLKEKDLSYTSEDDKGNPVFGFNYGGNYLHANYWPKVYALFIVARFLGIEKYSLDGDQWQNTETLFLEIPRHKWSLMLKLEVSGAYQAKIMEMGSYLSKRLEEIENKKGV